MNQAGTEVVEAQSDRLRKVLTVRDLVLAQVVFIMGLSWVGVAGKLGSSHVVFWVLAITLFYLPSAAVVIYLNRLMPLEGGLYQWAKFGFGELAGFMVAWNLWVYVIVLNSEIGIQSATMLAYSLRPNGEWMLENRWVMTAASIILTSTLTLVTIRGLQAGKWLQNAGGAGMVILFLALIALPFRNVAIGRLPAYHPFSATIPAFSVLNLNVLGKMAFGALGGFEFMAIFAAECKQGGRSITRSVLIATPLIAMLFVLGTSAIVALVKTPDIDLVSPISQALTAGTQPGDAGATFIPLLIIVLMLIRVAQCSVNFAGSSRLPLVAGWDHLLPAWFTRLHERWRTPVNSIAFVGAMTLVSGLLAIAGVGRQEAYQILNNTAGILYGLTYLVLFALPIATFRGRPDRPRLWLKAAAVSGFIMTALYVSLSVVPIIDVPNPFSFTAKVVTVIILTNVVGLWLFFAYQRRTRGTVNGLPESISSGA